MSYHPPFSISSSILKLSNEISESIGRLSLEVERSLRLHRINRIITIQGTLAIEGNHLSKTQITALLDGKPVIAPPREILEVQNAIKAYDLLSSLRYNKESDLKKVHKILMSGLLPNAGSYRQGDVGVMSGDVLIHMAPGANQVPRLMTDLFYWLNHSDLPLLIRSCIFHYEFEFIHPFTDGNGRMGRLWQTLILSQWQPIFLDIPVESLIFQNQDEYYQAISRSTQMTDCAPFIEFMLGMIARTLTTLREHSAVDFLQTSVETSVETPVETHGKMKEKTPEKILELLSLNPHLTLNEIADHLGKSIRTIERAVANLKKHNKLRHHGSKKAGHWEVLSYPCTTAFKK